VLDEIDGDLVEAFVRGDDFVVRSEQLIEERCLIGIELSLRDLLRNATVQVETRQPSFSPRFS
jgi:hypothetical protein